MERVLLLRFSISIVLFLLSVSAASGQPLTKTFQVAAGARVEIANHFGRVEAITSDPVESADETEKSSDSAGSLLVSANSPAGVSAADVTIESTQSHIRIDVAPKDKNKRIDIAITMPPRMRLKIDTLEGEVRVSGNIASADIRTGTGTIAADVPTDNIRYSLLWTASRPRFLSDFELEKVKEKAAGKFQVSGTYPKADEDKKKKGPEPEGANAELTGDATPNGTADQPPDGARPDKKKDADSNRISLNFQTARGIILLNIPPNEVTGDLRERPLTDAAKAIIRSGDSLLMEAIRRAAPKYYGDYTRTLGPIKLEPRFADRTSIEKVPVSTVKVATVRVSDINNRAMADLTADDFEVMESGTKREIVSVRRSTAPFNLVLLLDVSGSVDNYVTFIRKAARSFVNTVDARDRISIVTFNDDVKVISRFTTDKAKLSESLDTFDAGGATAYYDALAYTLADTLRPLKGERTAVVVLTDGDDNRSFLPFDSMLASIQESGALIYPLYVPSALIAASNAEPNASMDLLRQRYLQGELTSKAKGEGERLAKVSGGVYYQIDRLSQIQTAYEDIVRQLRTAYEVEYRSELGGPDAGVSPRLKIRTKQPNTYVQIRSVEERSGR